MANADTLNRVYQIPGARLLTRPRCSLVLPHSENLSEPVIDGYHGKLAAIGLQKVLLLNP
jgi:hypothetical protein